MKAVAAVSGHLSDHVMHRHWDWLHGFFSQTLASCPPSTASLLGTLILRHPRHAIWVVIMKHGSFCEPYF